MFKEIKISGTFRVAAHGYPCNLQYKPLQKITVVFHNFKNYDAKFLYPKLFSHPDISGLKLIGQTPEKFITIETKRFQFIDSYSHIMAPLEKIARNLRLRGEENFYHLQSEFPENYTLLLGKGSFPYEFLDCEAKLNLVECPPYEAFFSSLNNSNISDEDYRNVQAIYTAFSLPDLRSLLELYCKQDVCILADCMEFYRGMVRTNYNLEAVAYYSSPALSFDAALKLTKVEIELLQTATEYNFVASAVRGGVAMASQHYFKANNRYLQDYDENTESSFGFYADVTNLYGYCLSQKLPLKDFKWVHLSLDQLLRIVDQYDHNSSNVGYFIEISMSIPDHLHDYFADFPPMAERIKVTEDMISPWSKLLLRGQTVRTEEKLSSTLSDKVNHIGCAGSIH